MARQPFEPRSRIALPCTRTGARRRAKPRDQPLPNARSRCLFIESQLMTDLTRILSRIEDGDSSAAEQLLPRVYEGLRKLASAKLAKEKPGQTLQATALVHDAYIRLVNVEQSRHWNSRGHFFAAAAEAMRRILVEQARRKKRLRHGGDVQRLAFEDPAAPTDEERLLALHDALEKLARDDPAAAKVVELRHFAGLGHEQVASTLGITVYQARKKWTYARAWLRLAMQGKAD